MKKYLLLLLAILLMSVVFADPTYYYKKGELVDIKVPCRYLGHNCDNTAVCNISIQYPNGTAMVSDDAMTWTTGVNFNYTLSDSSLIGVYSANSQCCQLGSCDIWDFNFEINNTGTDYNVNLVGIIIGFLVFIIFFVVLGYLEKFWIMQWASYSLAFIELIYMAGVLFIHESGGSLVNLFKVNFYIMSFIGIGLVIITLFINSVLLATPEQDPENNGDKWSNVSTTDKWER